MQFIDFEFSPGAYLHTMQAGRATRIPTPAQQRDTVHKDQLKWKPAQEAPQLVLPLRIYP